MKHFIRQSLFVLVTLLTATVLVSCHQPPPKAPETGPHPLTPYQRSLVSEIRSSGAWVVKQGEVLQIGLPTDTFFRENTTNLKSNKLGAIDRVATLVKSYASYYKRPRISVSGYTDTTFSQQTRRRVSLLYAREVAAYLWNKGVSKNWVSVRGYGSKSPIASNQTPKGSAYNRRVVIRVS